MSLATKAGQAAAREAFSVKSPVARFQHAVETMPESQRRKLTETPRNPLDVHRSWGRKQSPFGVNNPVFAPTMPVSEF